MHMSSIRQEEALLTDSEKTPILFLGYELRDFEHEDMLIVDYTTLPIFPKTHSLCGLWLQVKSKTSLCPHTTLSAQL
jgi:hypothetical protein